MIDYSLEAWNEYVSLQASDKRAIKRINLLIKDIIRNGNTGIGHPEPLKHELSGYWSREIDDKNRLVYKISSDERIYILHCNGHYGDS